MRAIWALVAAWLLVWANPSAAADVSAYGRLPAIEHVRLSPSGARLAYISVAGEQRKLVVLELPEKTLLNVAISDTKVRNIDWAGDDHLLVIISNTASESFSFHQQEFWQYISVNVNTGKSLAIFAHDSMMYHAVFGSHGYFQDHGRWYGYFRGVTLVKQRGFDPVLEHSYADLYKVDLESGQDTLVARGSELQPDWAVDPSGVVIAHTTYQEDTGAWTLYADGATHQELEKASDPLGLRTLTGPGRTPGTVIVHFEQPREWTLATGAQTPLPTPDGKDIEHLLRDPQTNRVIGARLMGDSPSFVFYDPALQARYESLRKALGPNIVIESWSSDYRRVVVETEGKGDAGTYWLIDGGQANIIDNPYPDVPPASVGEARMVSYKASDGLEIPAVLTLPPGRPPHNLPVIVLPHGGPAARDSIKFDFMAQAFAAQGYAVLQPNFRGSDGYTVDFREAGYGQWGRKMQTDVSDGLAYLAAQGVVDSKRACIVGASYGGYAALAGVTVQHGLYRCSVSIAGVSDLNQMLTWEHRRTGYDPSSTTRFWRRFMGANSDGDPALHDISPAQLANRADAPILLIHGTDDTVVPIDQSKLMLKALQGAGKPVQMVTMPDEDHWLTREAGRKQALAAAVDFVEKYNPPN